MDLFGKKAQAENVELKKEIKILEEKLNGANKLYEKNLEELINLKQNFRDLTEEKEEYIKRIEKLNELATESDDKADDYANTIRLQCQRIEEKDKEIEELKVKNWRIKELEDILDRKNVEYVELLNKYKEEQQLSTSMLHSAEILKEDNANLEIQIKSLTAANKAKQIEIDRLKEDKDGKIYLDREKEEIKKLENIANKTKKARIKSKNIKKSIELRKTAIDRIQE